MRLWADLVFAARLARKYPLSTAAIVATLALCIGVNTAIFSVVDRVLLRALPYPQPDRLIQVITYGRGEGVEFFNDSQDGATWFALRDHIAAAWVPATIAAIIAESGKVDPIEEQRARMCGPSWPSDTSYSPRGTANQAAA